MLNRKAFAMDMGFNFGENTKIIATGGSSSNKSILQVMADVFNCPVYIKKTPEAACLGAGYRAAYVVYMEDAKVAGDTYVNYHDYIKTHHDTNRIAEPYGDGDEIYTAMLQRYREMVKVMMERQE